MQFPYAYKGVTKLFAAQILELLRAAVIGISVLIMLAGNDTSVEGAISGLLMIMGTSVMQGIALILEMIGLMQGRKDDRRFLIAFFIGILALFFAIAGPILNTEHPVLSGWMEVGETIFHMTVIEMVVLAVRSFATKLNDCEVVFLASRMQMVITILWVFIALLTIYEIKPTIISGMAMFLNYGMTFIVYALVAIFLGKARRMLGRREENTEMP